MIDVNRIFFLFLRMLVALQPPRASPPQPLPGHAVSATSPLPPPHSAQQVSVMSLLVEQMIDGA